MFLETLDAKSNGVIIFSINKFDLENNFWLIYKNSNNKTPIKIDYFQVTDYLNFRSPKNLIVYRLLTNNDKVDSSSSKFGFFLKVNKEIEVIYFDPIFALRDLNHLKFKGNLAKFRFKIQQIGLTSYTFAPNEQNYSSIYNSDLRAYEAINQSDKIFADAVFAFDDNYNNFNIDLESKVNEKLPQYSFKNRTRNIFSKNSVLDEEMDRHNLKMNKIDLQEQKDLSVIRERKMNMLKKALGIDSSKFIDDLKITEKEELKNYENVELKNSQLMDMFKNTKKSSEINSIEENVLLKIKKQ